MARLLDFLQPFLISFTKPWSKLAAVFLRHYGSFVMCKGHLELFCLFRCSSCLSLIYRHDQGPESAAPRTVVNINASSASHECEVEEHISVAESPHNGRSLTLALLSTSELEGSEDCHSCLVHPPIRGLIFNVPAAPYANPS